MSRPKEESQTNRPIQLFGKTEREGIDGVDIAIKSEISVNDCEG